MIINVQHFVFVFVQTVRVSGSSYLKEVGGGTDYLKEVSIGSDYLKEIGSGSSLLKENNTCQCVPGGTSRGYRNQTNIFVVGRSLPS